ncbi:MAG: aromatic ring-hydroxylating dioxygenase subunit alpha [Acidobacteria bacterium]|nr:aromatic ring-hydroxylating dioxygenase subunit alpha [Acidobacteriota bacterium]
MKSAPIDPELLTRSLAEFGASRTLPQECYTLPELHAWEVEHFWSRAWVCIGRHDDLANPGDRKAFQIGSDGILLVRGADGELRGFFNVCRHRAHQLLDPGECSKGAAIRCPYHGWTYELDGSLRIAPRTGELRDFDPADHSLVPVRTENWHGWIFLNTSGDAPPLAEYLGDLEDMVRSHEPERLRVAVARTYEVNANWKLVHENYHECYHCTSIHPQLCRVSPPDSGDNYRRNGAWVGGRMDLMDFAATMSLDGHSDGIFLRGLSAEQRRHLYYYGVLPNIFLSLHPDYILTHRIEPLAHNRTRIECQWLFPQEAVEKPGFSPDYALEFWDVTNKQDWHALEAVQRGISSRGYRRGPLTSKEDAVYQFVTRVARGYLEGHFDLSPIVPVLK